MAIGGSKTQSHTQIFALLFKVKNYLSPPRPPSSMLNSTPTSNKQIEDHCVSGPALRSCNLGGIRSHGATERAANGGINVVKVTSKENISEVMAENHRSPMYRNAWRPNSFFDHIQGSADDQKRKKDPPHPPSQC